MENFSVGDLYIFELEMKDSLVHQHINYLGCWTGSDFEIIGAGGVASFLPTPENQGGLLSQYLKIYKIVSQRPY